jgi:hypothetical protein
MLWTISAVLALLWLLSFVFVGHPPTVWVPGGLIHLILALVTTVFLLNLVMRHDPESSWA